MKSFTDFIKHFKKGLGKKGLISLGDMPSVVLVLAVVVITISMIATVLSDMQATQVVGSAAANATGLGITSMSTLAEWTPTIALVIAAALILGIILTAFQTRGQNM
jgi:hypothetical protein